MAVKKKKTTKAKSTKSASSKAKTVKETNEKKEKTYSFEELAEVFGISKVKAKAYFNMSQLDYGQKITIKRARELFNKF